MSKTQNKKDAVKNNKNSAVSSKRSSNKELNSQPATSNKKSSNSNITANVKNNAVKAQKKATDKVSNSSNAGYSKPTVSYRGKASNNVAETLQKARPGRKETKALSKADLSSSEKRRFDKIKDKIESLYNLRIETTRELNILTKKDDLSLRIYRDIVRQNNNIRNNEQRAKSKKR